MVDPDDLIKIETGRITIVHGLGDYGDSIFNVNIQGDIPYTTALGLLVAAKDHVDHIYFGDDEDDDDGVE